MEFSGRNFFFSKDAACESALAFKFPTFGQHQKIPAGAKCSWFGCRLFYQLLLKAVKSVQDEAASVHRFLYTLLNTFVLPRALAYMPACLVVYIV